MKVPVTSIVFPERKTKELDDEFFGELLESMKNDGQRVPVLLNEDKMLIDGRSRILAASALGWETIEADVVTQYEDAIFNLRQAHLNDEVRLPMTPRRFWEIYKATQPLLDEYLMRLKCMTAKARRKYYDSGRSPGLNPLPSALGLSHNTAQATRMVYGKAENDQTWVGDMCREEVAKIDAGLVSVGTAVHRYQAAARRINGATDVKTQRAVLGKVLVHLRSIESALDTLGPLNPEATTTEIDEWLSALYSSSTTLFRLRATLRKERESR